MTPTRWSGGSRVLSSGTLPPWVALMAARALGVMGLILAGVIAGRGCFRLATGGGNPVAASAGLLLAQALAWFYSAPPLTLHSRGLGEITTAVVVTVLTPLVGLLLQAVPPARIAGSLPILGAVLWPLIGLQFTMLLAIEFPDAAGDATVGKRTLVVRWGGLTAASLYRAVLVSVYGALPLLAMAGAPAMVMLAAALPVPIAVWQFWRLGTGAWRHPGRWESLAFCAVALLVITAASELAVLLWP